MASAEEVPNWTDVVATQGRYLGPSIDTPTVYSRYDADFVNALTGALRTAEERISARDQIYGDEADKWCYGHTPPLVRNALSEQDRMDRDWIDHLEAPTPSSAATTPFVSKSQPKHAPETPVTIPETYGARVAPVDYSEPGLTDVVGTQARSTPQTPSKPSHTPAASTPQSKYQSLSPSVSAESLGTNIMLVECPASCNAPGRPPIPAYCSPTLRLARTRMNTRKRRREQEDEDEMPKYELHVAKLRCLAPT